MPLVKNHAVRYGFSLLSDYDLHLFNEGNHNRLYEKLGAHTATVDGQRGTYFAVWAPNAAAVSVVGDFNGWNPATHPLTARADSSGIWEAFSPSARRLDLQVSRSLALSGLHRRQGRSLRL